MPGDPGQEKAFERQERVMERLIRSIDTRDAQFAARQERSERVFVAALSDIDASIQRNIDRLDDMGDAIRANTRAVLSVLDRLGS